ncbi:MAG: cytochrome P450 [Gammaproteobacteria bacterium]|nr:MAG: cytochrome P450 [Gammaproteobacteria bacterium]TDJ40160.1 MAG: cytochrome P450 [Gammaproteobacteria bacterium]
MDLGNATRLAEARDRAYSLPLERFDVSDASLFSSDTLWPYFERLRAEAPVHYCAESHFGPYWSLSRFEDIKRVDSDHVRFSSDRSITINDETQDFETPMFIAMDRPKHPQQRKVVSPAVAPRNLVRMEDTIRGRVARILDDLPVGETINWVERVSIELTTQMLTTLFDFPFEQRHRLTRWSDVASGGPRTGVVESHEQRKRELLECLEVFTGLWNERVNQEPGPDLISMLAHGESTRNMPPMEYLGNVLLLIIGGNDTTRNSITGGVLALNQFPDQYQKLRDRPSLIPNMVSEIIRWQTPVAHMRRTALEDVEIQGQQIRKGDKVVMWYVSGNRDPDEFERPDELIIDRPNARHHLSFGYGVHRCMGNRLAEMQLRIVWEEILERFDRVEVVGEPVRINTNLLRAYSELPVRLHRR